MKKRFISIAVTLVLVFGIGIPALGVQTTEAEAFSVRSSMPSYSSSVGKQYYYTNSNIFYQVGLAPTQKYLSSYGGYCTGNCTWYAYARASEILGYPLNSNFRWSASKWWSTNKSGNYYPYGSQPKVGAIACYSNHVAIVEKVENGKPIVSESGWTISKSKPTSASKIRFHYGSPWCGTAKGYIYITDSTTAQAKNVSYSVKITAVNLNMRRGPGTGYSSAGYVKAGTYAVSQEYGNWVKLKDSGYWVSKDYVKKVTTATEPVVSQGTAANYQAKITVANLNMRTGPGTSYPSKGYIQPGTYTITKTNNGWGYIKEKGYWVSLSYTTKVTSTSTSNSTATNGGSTATSSSTLTYSVKVNAVALRMRTGPGTNYSAKGFVIKGKTYEIKDTKNGWGQLKSNNYWIKLSYTIPVNAAYNVKITAKDLNMRTGPGITYTRKGFVKPGQYTISQVSGGWGKLKSNGYWVKLSYTKRI